jgi:inner membrane protein
VDNITHAFLGAAMAECALPRHAAAGARTAFMCAGVVAANAPDVDLVYNGIIEQPLGYLLHHRGHSHTLPGLGVLGILIWSGVRLWPRSRIATGGMEQRLLLLIAAALLGHLLMDTANSYGTHLWYPFSSGWVYGDAVFVLEPWLWAMLGGTLALNAGRLWRVLIALLTLAPMGALVQVGLLRAGVLAVLVGVVGVAAVSARRWPRHTRAAAALIATAAIVVLMSGLSRAAKEQAHGAIGGPAGEIVDIVADANPGVPWCWAVMVLQKADDRPDALVATRATLSLLPALWPATSCASARLSAGWATEVRSSSAVVWHRRWQIDLGALRALNDRDCRARAWLQFGRIPHVVSGTIMDLRFEHPIGQNFTPMAVGDAGGARRCPAYLTNWELPRRDVIESPVQRPVAAGGV